MELIVLIGVSGSGKSTYAKNHYPEHMLLSLDDIPNKHRPTWLNNIEQNIKEGKSIVADDENASKSKRKELIELGRRYGASVIAIYLNKPLEKILEQNKKRTGLARVPDVHIIGLYHAMKPKLDEEGFDKIIEINE